MGAVEHNFSLAIVGVSSLTDEMLDRLYDAGCSDGTFVFQSGRLTADFDRKAISLNEAIASAAEGFAHKMRQNRLIKRQSPE